MRVPVNSLGKMYRTCKQTCTNANSAASGRRISPTTVSGYIDEMIRNLSAFRSNRLLSGCAERSHDNRRGNAVISKPVCTTRKKTANHGLCGQPRGACYNGRDS